MNKDIHNSICTQSSHTDGKSLIYIINNSGPKIVPRGQTAFSSLDMQRDKKRSRPFRTSNFYQLYASLFLSFISGVNFARYNRSAIILT